MPHDSKIHLFTTAYSNGPIPLIERLKRIYALDIEKRARLIEGRHFRLDDLNVENPDFIKMNIIKLRLDEGPGKASLKKHVSGIGLEKDEGFAEETAAIYIPSSERWLVQYNHHGPRASAIAEYIADLEQPFSAFELAPVWRTDVMTELRRRDIRTKLQVKISPSSLKQLAEDGATGLSDALKMANKTGADTIDITISVSRGKAFGGAIDTWLSWFSRIRASTQVEAVEKFVLTAKGDGVRSKDIDLLAPRLEGTVTLQAGPDRRLPLELRWGALESVWNGWKSSYSQK